MYAVLTDWHKMEEFASNEDFCGYYLWRDEGRNVWAYHPKPCESLYLRETSIIRLYINLHLELPLYTPKSRAIYFV